MCFHELSEIHTLIFKDPIRLVLRDSTGIENPDHARMLIDSIASNTLCINIDGMDQSKFRIPRLGRIAQPKMLQALFRPTLHVTGSWLHGHRLGLWVSDEDLRKDSTTQQEVLSRTLSDAYQRFGSLPMGCCLQQDNCYREGKNRHIVSHMVLLVALRCFRFCVCNYLRTGHSVSSDISA